MRENDGSTPDHESPAPPPPRGPLRAVFGVLAERSAWGAVGYMLLSLVTGVLYFTWVVTGLSLSNGFSILIIGVPVFLGFVASVRILSQVEGALVETLLGARLPRRAAEEAAAVPSLGGRIKAALADSRTWGSMLYFLLELPLGVFYFSLFTTLLALAVSLVLAPWAQWLAGIPIVTAGRHEIWLPFWVAPLASIAGVVLLLATMHLARGLGRVQAALAERMLVRA
jgi:hypothetical protein